MSTKHEFHRTDNGSLSRSVECTCGFGITGYTWKWIDAEIKKHLEKETPQGNGTLRGSCFIPDGF